MTQEKGNREEVGRFVRSSKTLGKKKKKTGGEQQGLGTKKKPSTTTLLVLSDWPIVDKKRKGQIHR